MAKIKDLKFKLHSAEYSVPIRVLSSGLFVVKLPIEVTKPLGLNSEISVKSLRELEIEFFEVLDRFRKAETRQELVILIRYGASGKYQERKDGSYMFGQNGNDYYIKSSFDSMPSLGFEFEVAIKETVDTVESWFKAIHTSEMSWLDSPKEDEGRESDKYYKRSTMYGVSKYKAIPFSKEALSSLKNAQEKIRAASELLFDFIDQDEKLIELMLTNTKGLLGN